MRGYVPQFELATRLAYEGLAAGNLLWLGLADPAAGIFDDIVLGFQNHVIGYQVKSRRDPESFRIGTLLLGSSNLWKDLVQSWIKLRREHVGARVEVCYATDDYADTSDHLESPAAQQISSAAFLRAHEAYRATWTLDDWNSSPFAPLVNELHRTSALNAEDFGELWRNLSFITGGSARLLGLKAATPRDQRRQDALFGLIPKLIARAGAKSRWSTDELLKELGWRDPFGLRHDHLFPIDSLTQSNPASEQAVQAALKNAGAGYVSLVGPPGSGKSTLLQAGMVPIPHAIFVRYLAFVPNEGHGLGRAEATDFLQDIVIQLKKQGLGHEVVPGSELGELRQQFETMLRLAGTRFQQRGSRTIIIVDGLDHVPREERPEHSFLSVLPLPQAVPEGVIFLLGTQRLDIEEMPPSVRDQAGARGRRIDIAPLPREAIHRLADASGLTADIDRTELYQRSEGHPLSARYLIEGLLRIPSEDGRANWLRDGAKFGGNADAFYLRAWHDIEGDREAQLALSYVALVEGAIDPIRLDEIIGRAVMDRAVKAAAHLLRQDTHGRWSIFHNSFRLFLMEKTNIRFGKEDEAELQRRYAALAEMAKQSSEDDPQRWMELRYCARAKDHASVLNLATPLRFRAHFIDGRNTGDIQADIRFAFAAARQRRDAGKLYELLLCRHEIEMRADVMATENLVDAYIDAGDLDAAKAAIDAGYFGLPVGEAYKVIDALLEANRPEEARLLFEQVEPIDKLLGTEQITLYRADDELFHWARLALVFREPRHFLGALDRLEISDDPFGPGPNAFKDDLKIVAARAIIDSVPQSDIDYVCTSLKIGKSGAAILRVLAAEAAEILRDATSALTHLREAAFDIDDLGNNLRLRAAKLALALGDQVLAARYFAGMSAPTLLREGLDSIDRLVAATGELLSYSSIEIQLAESTSERKYPDSPLLKPYQIQLEAVGRLVGRGRAGRRDLPEIVWREVHQLLIVVAHGEGKRDFDSERWELDKALPSVAGAVLQAAAAHGSEALAHVISKVDDLLAHSPGRLGYTSFRRAFAVAAYRYERNTARALARLPSLSSTSDHSSPHDYVSEMCEQSSAMSQVGDQLGARKVIRQMHENALGISRPPKKDAQHEMWADIFEKASAQDPARRAERVCFCAHLLNGMSLTEGSAAAHRIAPRVLREAALSSSALADSVFAMIDSDGLAAWPTLIGATLAGIVRRRPDLAIALTTVLNHLALPFMDEFRRNIYSELISAAVPSDRQAIIDASIVRVQVDADTGIRLELLELLADLSSKVGVAFPLAIIDRWKSEAPEPKFYGTEKNPYRNVSSLPELRRALTKSEDVESSYYAARAFERLAPSGDYTQVKSLMECSAIAADDKAVLIAARAALAANQTKDLEDYTVRLRASAEKEGSWGQWQSGAKTRLHGLLVELEGETARRRAFDAFANDLSRGREWSVSLIPDVASVFEIISERPDWAAMWETLIAHLNVFRDYQAGRDLEKDSDCTTEEELVAKLLFSAMDLMTGDVSRQVRFAARELIATGTGSSIVVALIERLWKSGGDHAFSAIWVAWETRSSERVQALVRQSLDTWKSSGDVAVLRYVMAFALEMNVPIELPTRPLPQFYKLQIPETDVATKFEAPTGFSPTHRGLWTEDPYNWTWPLSEALKSLARATDYRVPILRLRVAEIMRREGGPLCLAPKPRSVSMTD
jgi:energy-coupling factor transporter ATP-binding protein EcfA2